MSTIKNQNKAIQFLLKYPNKWHSFACDYDTIETVCSLVSLGIAKINNHGQFRLKSENHANQLLNARGIK